MSGEWTRDHDRLIAKRCDDWNWVLGPAPNYSTDLLAVVRAAEAWRTQKPVERYWVLKAEEDSRGEDFAATVSVQTLEYPGVEKEIQSTYRFGNWWIRQGAEAGTAAEALAWALWKAAKEN